MIASDFSRRSELPELMDDPNTDYPTFRACLVDLAKANRWTLAHRPTLAFLERLRREGRWPRARPLRLVDVGSGYGDTIRTIDRWATRSGLAVELTGIDINPWSARAAAEATPSNRTITWVTASAFDDRQPTDVIVSSLFTHHLSDDAIARFLRRMEERAGIGWFINDLHRHLVPCFGFALLARAMRWHAFVQHDGPVSVARGFSKPDWARLIAEATIDANAVSIDWRFPFRLCVSRVKG